MTAPSAPPTATGPAGWTQWLDRRVLTVLFLGFASGLPYLLLFSTLSAWLTEVHVSRTAIGLFAMARTPFTFKPLWAPLIDRLPLPILTRTLGQRRGWALATQAALMLTLLAMASTNPAANLYWLAVATVATSFASASQDIVLDAMRVELLPDALQASGSGGYMAGYRLGLIVAGAGALYLASILPWPVVYAIMAVLVAVGMVAVLLAREPARPPVPQRTTLKIWVKEAVVAPFTHFATRQGWIFIVAFIAIYKLGDVYVNAMATNFYLSEGYTKQEIAAVTKLFGLICALCGALCGGTLAEKLGTIRSLLLCSGFMIFTNLMYAVLASQPHSVAWLTGVVGLEMFAGGMSSAAFAAFLSRLCDTGFTATQYALFSSLATLPLDWFAGSSGLLADHLESWPLYFAISASLGIPGLLMLGLMSRLADISHRPATEEEANQSGSRPVPA
ncbi:AmpG family muropeptide MFS transporter [Nitrospirillum sp. BR 11828]|uniref:AmpG family muropeptide MFS transporter n=1 Tax=Nitrospirillum sp. BR 11828 TaxID=3104325 RepID=UPI002ACA40CF|nr:AmpG family muropeptide MFS transporter [Nitrospirillum sp. BR 11828]MDZ5649022.1 AmpG family muropeptide MFS transporter [Nitrospirillum sp. BR 11828]